MINYISVHSYAKKIGVKPQNVYRWIREGKFNNLIKREIIEVERIRIQEDASKI